MQAMLSEDFPTIFSYHLKTAYVTGIREKHPDKEWFQVAGLIHDVGKIMAVWGEPQWCVVGDTFPVGCAPSKNIVFDAQFFAGNFGRADCLKNQRCI